MLSAWVRRIRSGVGYRSSPLDPARCHLLDHCGLWMPYEVRVPTYNQDKGSVQTSHPWSELVAFGRGTATGPGCQATAFAHTVPMKRIRRQLFLTPSGSNSVLRRFRLFDEPTSASFLTCRDTQSRKTRAESARGEDSPRILPNLLGMRMMWFVSRRLPVGTSDHDTIQELCAAGDSGTGPLKAVQDDADWEGYVRSQAYRSIMALAPARCAG